MEEYLLSGVDDADGKYVGGIYFHGTLQEDLGYDIVNVVGNELYQRIVSDIEKNIDAYALVNKEFKPVKMFLWTTESNMKRGLVCYSDDEESIKYATKKQAECAMWL